MANTPTTFERFMSAVKNNNLKVVENMLKVVDARFDDSLALRTAAEAGLLEMVHMLLPYSDPAAKDSTPICLAAEKGHLDIVKILLPFSDLSVAEWYIIREAAECGHTNVVQFLVPLCPPQAIESALTSACMGNQAHTVEFLKDKANINSLSCSALSWAVRNKNSGIFDSLIPYADTTKVGQLVALLEQAAYGGCMDIFQKLLVLIPDNTNFDHVLKCAALGGHQSIAELLYGRCDTKTVLTQLHNERLDKIKEWLFFDDWVRSEEQKAILNTVVEEHNTVVKSRKI